MASMSAQRSNSFYPSSPMTPHHKYDVFLSFRGKDVRDNFLEHLYRALRQKGILTFKDDDKLEDGETIKDGLFEAIEKSQFSIVIFSKNYADSPWCLGELVHILERKRTTGQIVFPIFYHVEPSEVRNRKGAFGEGFERAILKKEQKASTEKKDEEVEVKRWTEALEKVGGLKGWDYPSAKFENEAKLIDKLVSKIFNKSIDKYQLPDGDLVGIRSRMMQVIELLDLGSDKTRVVGLWGMGGIGKTTLAKVVYNSISWQFEGCSFIDVTEVLNRHGVLALQEHLISDILGDGNFRIQSAMRGTSIIQNRVCRKKALIVLDNVSKSEQVEDLVGELQRFGRESRIIITTRDEHVLTVCRAQDIFNVQELDKHDAIKLFKSKAFAENGEIGKFQGLIGRALQYAKGVPLALKVLGSTLLGGTVAEWESILDRLGESLDDELQEVLRISYERLHWKDKEIFLDICCLFVGSNKDQVIKILDGCGFNAVAGIRVLVRKSLLTISKGNALCLHDLIKKMGWSIVDEESRKEPGKRSRLWRHHDIKRVLTENTGTEKVEGICFDCPKDIHLRPDAFAKMTNLRVLIIRRAHCFIDFPTNLRYLKWILTICGAFHSIDLPQELRFLEWHAYPLKCIPSTFQAKHLVELHLVNSHIEQLWERTMELPKLSVLDLSGSMSLTKSPEFTGVPNLEDLFFKGCEALVDLHPSIGKLEKLRKLDFGGCVSLQTPPYGFKSQCIEVLNFRSCSKLNNIWESFGDLKQLVDLDLFGTGITELPPSIGNSTNLISLCCSRCLKLESIPSSIGQLKRLEKLYLSNCPRLRELPEEVGLIDRLKYLNVASSGVRQLPASVVRLRNLVALWFEGCIETPASTSQISNSMPLELQSFSGFERLQNLFVRNSNLTFIHELVCLICSVHTLDLWDSDIESLPASIKYLSNLKCLWIMNCESLQELPELPPNIFFVRVEGCESLKTICSLTAYREATYVLFRGCPKLSGNEEINRLLGYEFIYNHIKENNYGLRQRYVGPGSQIPEWLSYKNVGASVTLHVPKIDYSNASNLLGFAVSALVSPYHNHEYFDIEMTIKKRGKSIFPHRYPMSLAVFSYNPWRGGYPWGYGDVTIWYYPLKYFTHDELIQMSGTDLEFSFEWKKWPSDGAVAVVSEVKECGAHIIYKEDFTRETKRKRLTE